MSPGLEEVMSVSGTLESTHPIQRIFGAFHQYCPSMTNRPASGLAPRALVQASAYIGRRAVVKGGDIPAQ
jgi:hypothetical protein